jgi:hypothetical protein
MNLESTTNDIWSVSSIRPTVRARSFQDFAIDPNIDGALSGAAGKSFAKWRVHA